MEFDAPNVGAGKAEAGAENAAKLRRAAVASPSVIFFIIVSFVTPRSRRMATHMNVV